MSDGDMRLLGVRDGLIHALIDKLEAATEDKPVTHSHADLVALGEKWLKRQNCGVVFRDSFRAFTTHGEQPDVIGWRHNISILIECKASRADFLADRTKAFRVEPTKGIGDWRFYLCPKGLIAETELPSGWGLLYAEGVRISPVFGVPGNCHWGDGRPFIGDKECEVQMLYAALRRMVVRGHFDAIYNPIASLKARIARGGIDAQSS